MTVSFYFARHGETVFNVQNRVQGWRDTALTPTGLYDAYRLGQGLTTVEFVGACVSDAGRAQETMAIALEARENERLRLRVGLPTLNTPAAAAGGCGPLGAGSRGRGVAAGNLVGLRERSKPRVAAADDDFLSPDERRLVLAARWKPDFAELERVGHAMGEPSAQPFGQQAGPLLPVRGDTRLREWCFGELEGEPALRLRNRLFDLFGDDIPREEQNRRLDEIANYLAARDASRSAENFAAVTARIQSFLEDCGRSVERRGGGNVFVVTHALLIRSIVFLYAYDRVGDSPKIKNGSVTEVVWDDGAVTVGPIGADPSELFSSAL